MLVCHVEDSVQSEAGVVVQHGFPALAIDLLPLYFGADLSELIQTASTEFFDGLA